MSPTTPFPLERLVEIHKRPEDFRLLERVPLTCPGVRFPALVNQPVGDEQPLVMVDVETTGLDADYERIIELGLLRATYSPSAQRITEIIDVWSRYEDPGRPIPDFITELTGIRDDDVAGREIDDGWVTQLLENDPLVIAHHARFDAAFLCRRFSASADRRWACTASEIPWQQLGYESRKLEYLLLRHGWFYDGHRASTDCLATLWLMIDHPEAFKHLLVAVEKRTVVIHAFGSPLHVKDTLKRREYHWHPGDEGCNRCWWKEVPEECHALESSSH